MKLTICRLYRFEVKKLFCLFVPSPCKSRDENGALTVGDLTVLLNKQTAFREDGLHGDGNGLPPPMVHVSDDEDSNPGNNVDARQLRWRYYDEDWHWSGVFRQLYH